MGDGCRFQPLIFQGLWPRQDSRNFESFLLVFPQTSQGALLKKSSQKWHRVSAVCDSWWSRRSLFLNGGNGSHIEITSIYLPYNMFQNKQKSWKSLKNTTRCFLKRIDFLLLLWSKAKMKSYQEWPRGTSRCCILPPWSLTARLPWKVTFPIGKDRLPTTIFQGAMLNFRGVRLYGMQPKTLPSMPMAKVSLSFWEGVRIHRAIPVGSVNKPWNPGWFMTGSLFPCLKIFLTWYSPQVYHIHGLKKQGDLT